MRWFLWYIQIIWYSCIWISVVLAVNPDTGQIVNKAAAGEGKVDIDIHSTCTAHSASHPGYVVQKPKRMSLIQFPLVLQNLYLLFLHALWT